MSDQKEKEPIPTYKEAIDSHNCGGGANSKNQQPCSVDINKLKVLQNYTTAELVECLKRREGVIATIAVPPTDGHLITVNGPAVVMIVID